MKWKKVIGQTSITLLFLFMFATVVYGAWEVDSRWTIDSRWIYDAVVEAQIPTYTNHIVNADGNVLMRGGIHVKPNSIHTYIPQFHARYTNITLSDGTLGLSKDTSAYTIYCSTSDNVTINLYSWFYAYRVRFDVTIENESTAVFQVNSRTWGEPDSVTGEDSWSYDASSTTTTLTASDSATIQISWLDPGAAQLVWYLDRIPMFLGITGFICLMLSPGMFVIYARKDDLPMAFIFALGLFILGLGLVVGWLWG